MPCLSSIPVEISRDTPRLSTGKQLGSVQNVNCWLTPFSWATVILFHPFISNTHKCLYHYVCYVSDLRQPTQDAPEEVRARDFRRELEERERAAAREKTRERGPRGWRSCFNMFSFLHDICTSFICLDLVPTQAPV